MGEWVDFGEMDECEGGCQESGWGGYYWMREWKLRNGGFEAMGKELVDGLVGGCVTWCMLNCVCEMLFVNDPSFSISHVVL